MSEEKKLDEKALEEVTGGSMSGIVKFESNNCAHCGHMFNHTCPYGSAAKALAYAIEEFGKSAWCPEKVALQ